ncbi:GTPase IMAP family member 8 isoform X1 [Patella vulgata]|uniref:GTPase IMAP family member 8 isoform X1 n=1 Tax=Patella vulgata TaxID=6465 RepID=UPI00217F63A4|nr:GTPase IMAP family member 8 isoform X1 [Patella vulgata]
MASGDREDIRLVLLGKKGVGKSSLGNSLLGRKEFKSTPLQAKCRKGSTTLADGTNLDAVDTPGIADTTASTTETFEELTRCIELSTPGPHVFLLVLKIDRFTQEEIDTIKHLKYWFGQDFMKYAVFIFTGKDSLDYDGSTINQHLENSPSEMKALIGDAGRRVAAINNRGRGPELEVDVKTIMTLVKQAIRINNCQYYTKEMYQQAVQARAKQPGWVEDEQFNGEKDLRIRETLKRYREDEEAQRTRKNKDLHIETMPSENSNSEIRIVILGKTGVGKSSLGNHLIQNNCFQSSSTGTSVTSICQFGQDIRLVLIGKSGTGKSSLGNNLLGRKEFKSTSLQNTNTLIPECRRGSIQLGDGTNLVVVDTPGIADTTTSTTETFEELTRCIELSNPGPHVFVLVLKIDRFTQEEMNIIKHLKYWFGQDFMKYAVFIFTGKDSLDYDGSTIGQHIEGSPSEIKALIREAGGRIAAINNRVPGPELKAVMNLVKQTVQINNGQYYTQHMYRQAVKEREGQPSLMEDDQFKDVKDLRIREMLRGQTRRQDTKDQVENDRLFIITLATGAWYYLTRLILYVYNYFRRELLR